jgi:hypothetical protein
MDITCLTNKEQMFYNAGWIFLILSRGILDLGNTPSNCREHLEFPVRRPLIFKKYIILRNQTQNEAKMAFGVSLPDVVL